MRRVKYLFLGAAYVIMFGGIVASILSDEEWRAIDWYFIGALGVLFFSTDDRGGS